MLTRLSMADTVIPSGHYFRVLTVFSGIDLGQRRSTAGKLSSFSAVNLDIMQQMQKKTKLSIADGFQYRLVVSSPMKNISQNQPSISSNTRGNKQYLKPPARVYPCNCCNYHPCLAPAASVGLPKWLTGDPVLVPWVPREWLLTSGYRDANCYP